MTLAKMQAQQVKFPKACIILLTLGCKLKCKMCHLWRNDESNLVKPSLKEWLGFIDSLGAMSEAGFNVIFGGGEPLLFPETVTELISSCHQKGFRTSLATSGYFLDRDMANRLISAKLDYIALTLYSLEQKTHNFLRGMPDSHERLLQAIEYLDGLRGSLPLEIAIDTVIMAPNLKDILELARWVDRDDRLRSIFFQAVVQPFHSRPQEEWHKSAEYSFLWPPDTDQAEGVIDELIKLKKDNSAKGRDKINNPVSQLELFKSYFRKPQDFIKKFSCNVTSGDVFTVSPDGNVNLCPYLEPIGNIRTGDIKDIWHSQEAYQRRQEMAACKQNCHHIINCWYEEEGVSDKAQ